MGHSRRFGFVRFRWHCRHEFLRRGRDGPSADSFTAATALDLPRSDRDSPLDIAKAIVVAFAPVLELIVMRPRRLSVDQESNRRPTIFALDQPRARCRSTHHPPRPDFGTSRWLLSSKTTPLARARGEGAMSLPGPERRKAMSAHMSAIGGTSGLVLLTMSFVGSDPEDS
jgi:hypothetical protein